MNLGLNDKVCFVAASSKGLGFSIVKTLLEEDAYVIMNGRSHDDLISGSKKLGNSDKLKIYCGDVTKRNVCLEGIAFTIREFGQLDILVTNCGGPDPGGFESVDEDQWRQAIEKSLMSHIFLIEAALPHLKKSKSPSILSITSFTVKTPVPNLILSNSIRAATVGLTKSLANELGAYGIRVNSILPGWTMTNRVDQLLNARSDSKKTTKPYETDLITQSIPLKRMADPDEFSKVAAILVSPAASYVTGVMLNVDGGINQSLF